MKISEKKIWKILAFLMLILFVSGLLLAFHPDLHKLIINPEILADFIRSYGVYSKLALVIIQMIQVIIFWIPGEVTQVAAGFVFGAGWGFILSFMGIMLGSFFNFYIARLVGKPLLVKIIDTHTLLKIETALKEDKGQIALFLIFLMPGIPKDALCYVAGATGISYISFILISGAGRIPALFFSVLFGENISTGHYTEIILITALFTAFFLTILYAKNHLKK